VKKILFLIYSLTGVVSLYAQNILQDPVTGRVFNSDKYSAVKGSPFLFDEWIKGSVTTPQGVYKNLELKLDSYTNTVFFKSSDEPYEFRDKVIGFTLMPRPGDSSTYLNFKNGISGNGLRPDQFTQVLAEGKLSVYKADIKLVADVNQINQGVIKTFTTSTRYFAMKDNVLQTVKMNKASIYELIKDKEQQIDSFVAQNKLSTRKEADLVKIVQYYNTL
jgi:hypothetical protein